MDLPKPFERKPMLPPRLSKPRPPKLLDPQSQTPVSKLPVFRYWDPKVCLSRGKHGPVDLILTGPGQLRALKRISKASIDGPKRLQHIFNEKTILRMFPADDFVVKLESTFISDEHVCLVLEFCEGPDLSKVLQQ